MRALALLVLIAAATPGEAQVLPRRFAAAENPADQPSPGSFVEAAAAPSLFYRSTAGSALGMGIPLGVAVAMMPPIEQDQAWVDVLLNGVLVGGLASTAGAVIGARSAATDDRPISTGRAITGAALGFVPGYVAGLFGGAMGALGAGKPGAVVGFVVPYALVQGALTTWLAPARR